MMDATVTLAVIGSVLSGLAAAVLMALHRIARALELLAE